MIKFILKKIKNFLSTEKKINGNLYIDYEEITGVKDENLYKSNKDILDFHLANIYKYTDDNNKLLVSFEQMRMTPKDTNNKKEVNKIYEPDGIFKKNANKENPFHLIQCLICSKEVKNKEWANSHTIPRSSLKNISDKSGDSGTLTLYPNSYENYINKYRNNNFLKPVSIEQAGTFKLICNSCEKSKPFESNVNNLNYNYSFNDYADITETIFLYNIHHMLNIKYIEESNCGIVDNNYDFSKEEEIMNEINKIRLLNNSNLILDVKKIWDSKDTHKNGIDINACIMMSSYSVWKDKSFTKFYDKGCLLVCFPDPLFKRSRCIIFGIGEDGVNIKNRFDLLNNDDKINEFLFMAMTSNGLFAIPNDSQFVDFLNKNGHSFLSGFKEKSIVQKVKPYEYYMSEIKDKRKFLSYLQ